MRIAKIVHHSIAEGPGLRTVIWFQGCPIHCPGCYNPQLWPFEGGQEMTTVEVMAEVEAGLKAGDVGVSLVGGEPLAQPEECAWLCLDLYVNQVHTIVYTGLTYEDILELAPTIPAYRAILDHANVLVDGPFIKQRYARNIAYRGSRNQRVIDLAATRLRQQAHRRGAETLYIPPAILNWDSKQTITIRPDGAVVAPAHLATMFAGQSHPAHNCGQANR